MKRTIIITAVIILIAIGNSFAGPGRWGHRHFGFFVPRPVVVVRGSYDNYGGERYYRDNYRRHDRGCDRRSGRYSRRDRNRGYDRNYNNDNGYNRD